MRRLGLTAAVAVVVVVADQLTKSWAVADLRHATHLVGPLGVGLTYNAGTAFSMLTGAGAWLVPVLVLLVLGVAGAAWAATGPVAATGYGLFLGGAVSNLGDRLLRAHHSEVVDWITLTHWPTFNLADAAITVGVVLVAGVAVLGTRAGRKEPAAR